MPELPDIVVYLEALQSRVVGERLERLRIASPFLLRSVDPRPDELAGRVLGRVTRLGKRVVFGFDDEYFVILHLMIAGRLRWKPPGAVIPGRLGLAAFDFPAGTLLLTEAGSKHRASLYLARGAAGVAAHDPGGIDVLAADLPAFRAALTRESHTLKRALTDPRLFSGVGNAYSDEILHAAKLSPLKLTTQLTAGKSNGSTTPRKTRCAPGSSACAKRRGTVSPRESRRSARRWRCTAGIASRVRCAARRSSGSATPKTR